MSPLGASLRRFLQPPEVEGRELSARARTFHTILLAGTSVLAVMLLVSVAVRPRELWEHFPYASMLALHVVELALLRSGRVRLSIVSHCVLYVVCSAAAMVAMGGIRSPAGFVFPPAVLMAGLIWSGRAAVGVAVASSVIGLILVWLEAHGLLPVAMKPTSPIWLWAVLTATLFITAIMLYVALRQIREHHSRALQHEQAKVLLERELEQSRRLEAIGRLSAGVAHDFNNLLTVIIGQASIAPRDDPEVAEALDTIEQAGQRGAELTRQLLAFGRRQVLNPEVVDLNRVMRDLEPLLTRLLGAEIRLQLELGDTEPVAIDRVQLEQVIVNLVSNARDAISKQGTIKASSGMKDGMVWLAVEDDGAGMDEEEMKYLFEPFYTTKKPGAGTGLGLPMVHGIVTQSGGRIEVRSERGKGARFELSFPRSIEAMLTEESSVRLAPAQLRNLSILVVDDDPEVRRVSEVMLVAEGQRVQVASGPEEAVLKAKAMLRLDLLVTDVVMPSQSGVELYERLRQDRPELRVLFCSGYAEALVERKGVVLTKHNYLPKPFTREALAAKIQAVMVETVSPRSVTLSV